MGKKMEEREKEKIKFMGRDKICTEIGKIKAKPMMHG
jgi:hypothetical protein